MWGVWGAEDKSVEGEFAASIDTEEHPSLITVPPPRRPHPRAPASSPLPLSFSLSPSRGQKTCQSTVQARDKCTGCGGTQNRDPQKGRWIKQHEERKGSRRERRSKKGDSDQEGRGEAKRETEISKGKEKQPPRQ